MLKDILIVLINNLFKEIFYGNKIINIWKILTNALRALINNLYKESFYEKRKKNVLTTFFIFYKSDIKTFLK